MSGCSRRGLIMTRPLAGASLVARPSTTGKVGRGDIWRCEGKVGWIGRAGRRARSEAAHAPGTRRIRRTIAFGAPRGVRLRGGRRRGEARGEWSVREEGRAARVSRPRSRRARPSGVAREGEGAGNGRDARRAPPRLAWSAAAMFALPVLVIAGGRTAGERRGGGHRGGRGQSREGGKKTQRCGDGVRAREGCGKRRASARGTSARRAPRSRTGEGRTLLARGRRARSARGRLGGDGTGGARPLKRESRAGYAQTGTTVVSSASSPDSPFLRFRRFLNPGKERISSAGVGGGARDDCPGARPAACRLAPASSLRRHSRNSLTWLSACSTLFR